VIYVRVEFLGGPFDGVSEARTWGDIEQPVRFGFVSGHRTVRELTPEEFRTSPKKGLLVSGRYRRLPNQEIQYVEIAEKELENRTSRDRVIEHETAELKPTILHWERA
jgi:hypothetical protein